MKTYKLPQSRRLRETRRDSSLKEGACKEKGTKKARAALHAVRAVITRKLSRERNQYSTVGALLSRDRIGGPMRASAPTERNGGAGDG